MVRLTPTRTELLTALFVTAVGIYLDYAVIHPEIFSNAPAASYFLVKAVIVGGILAVGIPAFRDMFNLSLHHATHTAVLAAVITLGVYYGYYPVELMSGEAVQIGLRDSVVIGTIVHGGAFWLPTTLIGLREVY